MCIKNSKMKKCIVCSGKLNLLIDLGKFSYSSQAKKSPACNYTIVNCNKCYLIQLKKKPKIEHLRSKDFNLRILEPENHIDDFIKKILELGYLRKKSKILGLSYKDKSFINKIKKKGFYKSTYISNKAYGIPSRYGVETIQNILLKRKKLFKNKNYDLIILRHMLEHAFEPEKYIKKIKNLLSKNGLIAIELPCNKKMIKGINLHYFWEHHISYFNMETLKNFLVRMGFKILKTIVYPQSSEDNIVIIAKIGSKLKKKEKNKVNIKQKLFLKKFKSSVSTKRKKVKDYFEKLQKEKKMITLLGAGHLGIKFMNFFNINSYFNQIVDDNKKIYNLRLPNTNCKITNSKKMKKEGIFFSSLNHESEKKFLSNNKFLINKVKIFSISKYGNNSAPFN